LWCGDDIEHWETLHLRPEKSKPSASTTDTISTVGLPESAMSAEGDDQGPFLLIAVGLPESAMSAEDVSG